MGTRLSGSGLKGSISGLINNFTVNPSDKDGNPLPTTHLQLLLRHNMSEKHSKFITSCEPNYCIVYYVCIEAGSYLMNLLLDNKHIAGSPFVVHIHPGPMNASRTFAMAIDSHGKPIHQLSRTHANRFTSWTWTAGEVNFFTINPRDTYGNKIPNYNFQQLTFSHNLSISSPLKMRSEILSDGRLQVTANTTSTEPFKLSIMQGEQHILNSPIEVKVQPGEVSPKSSVVKGTGLIDARVGIQSELLISIHDAWNNPNPNGFLTSTCHSPNCSLAIENHHNGSFSILYTPYKEERLALSILVNGVPISGSPFSTLVKSAPFPLPPLEWDFIGPFDWKDCLSVEQTQLQVLGLCDHAKYRTNILQGTDKKYPSSLLKQGKVSWRKLFANGTGYSSFRAGTKSFFGWVVGDLNVDQSREYYVICDGVDEYYINQIHFSGGSWHPVFLETGVHILSLFLSSNQGFVEYYCDFMASVETSNWPIESLLDPSVLPVSPSWLMIIQLVVLFKCLEAVLGPLYRAPEEPG